MADISANAAVVYEEGTGERAALYRVRKADTADTLDVAPRFSKVKVATFLASGTLATIGTAAIAGTVLTLTLATMADENIYLLVVGSAAVG